MYEKRLADGVHASLDTNELWADEILKAIIRNKAPQVQITVTLSMPDPNESGSGSEAERRQPKKAQIHNRKAILNHYVK